MHRSWIGWLLAVGCVNHLLVALLGAAPVAVGLAERDITPDIHSKYGVWIAGYGQNRKATGVHDPLAVRAIVFKDGDSKIAMACADVVGLQYPTVLEIREKLPGYKYVMISSTHNHEGPDTIGIWGPSPIKSGIDPAWLNLLKERTIEAIEEADRNAVPAEAFYGTATDDKLLRDSREPYVYDGVLRALRFRRVDNGKLLGVLVQWNCHPESLGSDNKLITADFIGVTVAELKKQYDCPVAYFTGDVGGLMAPPRGYYKDEQGVELKEGDYKYCQVYGEDVARLARQAIDAATPIDLAKFAVSAKAISVPLGNPLYRAASMLGVLKRPGHAWTGDFEQVGDVLTPKTPKSVEPAAMTEVGYIRLGELHIACIPGEVYPESVYGKYQDPVDPGADFPDAPLEKPIMKSLPGEKTLLIGLANDEIGYIVPKRQWDVAKPFAYGRDQDQYGEENSMGVETAPILYQALDRRVSEASGK